MTSVIEFTAIKDRQRKVWASADYPSVAATIHPMSELLVEATGLAPGARVLDVATGTGNAAIAAARRNCAATGLDYVPQLLDKARARTAAEGLSIEYVEGDAEELPFPDASFDAVISVVGVMFAPDQARAAAELTRVCRPGGTIALASWTPTGLLGAIFRAIGKNVPPPAGVRPPVEWGDESRLRELFGTAVSDLHATEATFGFPFASSEELIDWFHRTYGPMQKAFEALDTAGQSRLQQDLVDGCRPYESKGREVTGGYLRVVATRA
jgi:SAM-dependent methyltransferase